MVLAYQNPSTHLENQTATVLYESAECHQSGRGAQSARGVLEVSVKGICVSASWVLAYSLELFHGLVHFLTCPHLHNGEKETRRIFDVVRFTRRKVGTDIPDSSCGGPMIKGDMDDIPLEIHST